MSVRGSPERATAILMLAALLAKATGFLRVAALTAVLGASPESDAFLTAFLIPEILYLWFTEGGMTAALVRVFVHFSGPQTLVLLRRWALGLGLLASALLALGAEVVVSWVAPGFPASTRALAVGFVRLVSLYVPLTLTFFVYQAERNSHGTFLLPALGPLGFNTVLLLVAYQARSSDHPGQALVWAVVLGGVVQLLSALPVGARSEETSQEPQKMPSTDPGLWPELLALTLPTAALVALLQLQFVFERFLLSRSAVGTITRFSTAQKLVNLPLGLVAVSLATALLPYLAQRALEDEERGLVPGILAGLQSVIWIMTPITVLTSALSLELVGLAFGRGGFTPGDVFLTAQLVEVAAPATIFLATSMFLIRGFLAAGDGRTPARIKGVAVTSLLILDFWLFPHYGPRCLFLNAALVAGIEAVVLFRLLPGPGKRSLGLLLDPFLRALLPGFLLFHVTRLLLPGNYGRAGLVDMAYAGTGGLLAFGALAVLLGGPSPRGLLKNLQKLRA